MLLQELETKKLIHPPSWLSSNCHYLCIMGSAAYGVQTDASDLDLYGFCIPKKEIVFPHLANKLIGFDKNLGTFDQWQQHHIYDPDALGGKGREYDFQIFNIIKYFSLLLDCNPNIIDAIFVPANCIIHITKVGNMVRDNRKMFLHKGAWHRFKGYAYSQMNKMHLPDYNHCPKCNCAAMTIEGVLKAVRCNQDVEAWFVKLNNDDLPDEIIADLAAGRRCAKCGSIADKKKIKRKSEKRQATVEAFGYDIKFGYHLVRLMLEIEQILTEGDLDLQRNREQLKSIRRGEWTEQQIRDYFTTKEKELETLYNDSKLPWGPDEAAIKKLLLECLEEHYGSLSKCIEMPDKYKVALDQIAEILHKTNI